MLPIFLILVAIWGGYASMRAIAKYDEVYAIYDSKLKQRQMIRLSENMTRFVLQTGSYPASMASMATVVGYEHTKGYFNNWQSYAVSPVITDTNWKFRRAVLFTFDPTTGLTSADYLARDNLARQGGPACGAGGFNVAVGWCGSLDSMWHLIESRDGYNEQIVTERARVIRLSQKFANYYNGFGYYPKVDGANVALVPDTVVSLAALVGYTGTASGCTGQYQYQGVPIDCSDMFNSWGMAVGYQFIDAGHIILVSETPIINAAGVPVIVAVDRA